MRVNLTIELPPVIEADMLAQADAAMERSDLQ